MSSPGHLYTRIGESEGNVCVPEPPIHTYNTYSLRAINVLGSNDGRPCEAWQVPVWFEFIAL